MSDEGEVCDAYVPAQLQDESVLKRSLGAPVGENEHDPLCRQKYQEFENYKGYCPDCDLIKKAREDERKKANE
jgi:hypothetical protein